MGNMHSGSHCQVLWFTGRAHWRTDPGSSRGQTVGQSVRLEGQPWDSGEEVFGVGVARLSEERFGGPRFHDIAMLKNRDPLTERGYRQQIVGNVEDTHAEPPVEARQQF